MLRTLLLEMGAIDRCKKTDMLVFYLNFLLVDCRLRRCSWSDVFLVFATSILCVILRLGRHTTVLVAFLVSKKNSETAGSCGVS